MKYKALMLSFLLLLPVGLLALPHSNANQNVVPSLYVNPPDTKFYGPCLKSTTFSIDVILWNNALSKEDIYAFDFIIDWSSISSISLVSATAHSPWANSFTIANINTTMTNWHLAITATPPSTGLTDVSVSVLTLVFHIDTDVCWPTTISGTFDITNVKLSGDSKIPPPVWTNAEIDGGTFEEISVQPNIDLTSTAANATGWIIQKCVSHTFDVEVDLTNVTDVYGFSFTLTFDATHLETDVQKITFKSAFPPPYETLSVVVGQGTVTITLIRPSEKPTVCGAVIPAVDIIFHTIDTADGPHVLPTTSTTPISITAASVSTKCPGNVVYSFPGALLYGGDLTYYFKPSKYDLNLDCVVDVQDLAKLLPYYGTISTNYGDLFNDGAHLVDIFDFVVVAKSFGPVDP